MQPFRSANVGRLDLHIKHSTECETVAKIEDTRVAKLRNGVMTMYNVIGICRLHKGVANCNRWPTYKGGELHRIYCVGMCE
jgi:hypothetical protein